MDAQVKDRLAREGIDVAKTIERFANNESLYERFLKKFAEDDNFAGIKREMGNFGEELMRYAHTLKGLSANLGMTRLSEVCDGMVRKLRGGTTEGLDADFAALEEEYNRMIRALGEVGLL